jgi:hypothetical protein
MDRALTCEKGVPMSAAAPSEVLAPALDWDELSGLERIVKAYSIGDHSVVLELTDGREIRITACHDRAAGIYVSEYERRGVVRAGGQELRVWAQTPAYRRITAEDAASCLEAAVLQVDRINVY